MSEYEKLSTAYKDAFERFWKYKKDCREFALAFTDGLGSYLGCSRDAIKTFMLAEHDQLKPTVPGGGDFDDDGYYTSWLELTIPLGGNLKPDIEVMCKLSVKVAPDTSKVKLECFGQTWEDKVSGPTPQETYRLLVLNIVNAFGQQLDATLRKKPGPTIGFKAPGR